MAAELRARFSKSRRSGVWLGLGVPALVCAVLAVFLTIRALRGDDWGWWLVGGAVMALVAVVRFRGRPISDIGPSLLVEGLLRLTKQHIYRGGPIRKEAEQKWTK